MVSEDLPPSYDEAIRDEAQPQSQSQGNSSRPEAPPPDYSSVPGSTSSRPLRDRKRPVPPKPPAKPPTRPSSKPAKPATKPTTKPAKPATKPTTKPAAKPDLPWTYPPRYYCEKCHNTGYKLKNGKSCKRCWRKFATPNAAAPMGGQIMVNQAPPQSTYYSGLPFGDYFHPFDRPTGGYYAPPAPVNNNALYVRPGDPRLGGVLCGECRGSGRVRFFLDEDLCPLCNGVGRIIR
ncbi:Proline-rich protein HUA1 [Nakaseomyces bracarensis]|uniref:Proline-rich protein HUA1 n=1 Tax=Nakaseomyces bracarensis TaxID=273131 RepID=A0ABR4NWY5_9SACH